MSSNSLECLKVALIQQDTVWESPVDNRSMTESQLDALDSDVDMVVLPETFTTGFSDNMGRIAEPPEGETLFFARRMAAMHQLLFVATWTIRDPSTDTVYNRLHWVRPDGTYAFYDKGHTFRMSSEASQLGAGRSRPVFEWKGWRVRPAICYDLRFPVWLRNRYDPVDDRLDYDLLLFAANWPASRHRAWQTLLCARAIENISYVIGVNRVGKDGVGIPYDGYSAAVDFRGNKIGACIPRQPDCKVVTLDRKALETFRSHWPFFLDADQFSL